MAKTQSAGKRRSRRTRTRTRSKRRGSRKSGGGALQEKLPEPASLDELDNTKEVGQDGGKRRRGKKGKKSKKKMNEFFRLLIDAKKHNKDSFSYKGKTYKKKVGTKKNPKLVVYTKA
tara:strand:+ start:196 stop:546 length:351 start_codon:yes stop_codon:yes gene_type:complete